MQLHFAVEQSERQRSQNSRFCVAGNYYSPVVFQDLSPEEWLWAFILATSVMTFRQRL